MIEIIYSDESGKQEMPSSVIRLPRNVRQIGSGEDKKKIYVEDYVMTYIGKLWDNPELENTAGALLGTVKYSEGVTYIFISGAMVAENVLFSGNGIIFSDEAWTGLYENMKEYFNELEIVGWFLVRNDSAREIDEGLYKAHVDNFAGVDKVLLLADAKEKEEEFYIYHNASLQRQNGYYIYYEKNECMQAYMVEKKQGKSVDEEIEDKVIGSYRALVQEKRENNSQRHVVTALYSACTFLAVVVLAIGVTMMNNYDKMKNMEAALNSLTQNITGNADDVDEKKEMETIVANVTVEKVDGNVAPTTETPSEAQVLALQETQAEALAETQPVSQLMETQTVSQSIEETTTEQPQTIEETQEAMGPKAGIFHVVEEGDTLTSISMEVYHTDTMVEEIKEANGIVDENKIYLGQEIYLP